VESGCERLRDGKDQEMMMCVCVHTVILTLCTATDALDGQGRPSALAQCVLVIFWASLRVSNASPSRISMIGPSISGWRALFLSNNGY
jgi:hypothetical protein